MLVNFIGSPASGKTTTAAMLFATLKECGVSTEFIVEEARRYIALRKESPEDMPLLSDADQYHIMATQLQSEQWMVRSCGPQTLVISDGSPLNALLYMSPEFRGNTSDGFPVQKLIQYTRELMKKGSLTFLCEPLWNYRSVRDPNRVHSSEEIQKIDDLVVPVMSAEFDLNGWHWLRGSPKERLTEALRWACGRLI